MSRALFKNRAVVLELDRLLIIAVIDTFSIGSLRAKCTLILAGWPVFKVSTFFALIVEKNNGLNL